MQRAALADIVAIAWSGLFASAQLAADAAMAPGPPTKRRDHEGKD
jgi:hypothetical protein